MLDEKKRIKTCVTAGLGGKQPSSLPPSILARSGTALAKAFKPSFCWTGGVGGARKGWEMKSSKLIRSLASLLSRWWRRWVNSGEVPLGTRGARRAFLS